MKKGKKWKKIEAFCILLIVTLLLIFVRILYQPWYGVGKGRVVHLQQWMVSAEGWEKDGAQIAVFCYSG